jgi:hypothetical protein
VAREVAQGGSHIQRSGTRVTRGGSRRLAAKIRHAGGSAFSMVWRTTDWLQCDGLHRTAVLLSLHSGLGLNLIESMTLCIDGCRMGSSIAKARTMEQTTLSTYLQVD